MAVPVDQELQDLLQQFVCVRIIQGWGLDLNRFQFDGFLTWSVFFLNADGTIYGRYGSRSKSGYKTGEPVMSLEGFKKTLKEAIRLHVAYSKDPKKVRPSLEDKTGQQRLWRFPQDIPELKKMFPRHTTSYRGDGTHGGCIHCHMIPRAELAGMRRMKRPIPDQTFWPYPLPREIGMEMDPKEVASVLKIRGNSPAAKADLRMRDRIKHINGQPILSTADIQWILHHAKKSDTLEIDIERGGKTKSIKLHLDEGWQARMGDWRYLNELMIGDLFNFRVAETDSQTRQQLGLNEKTLALKIEAANAWKDMPQTSLQNGDVVVAIDGKRVPMSVATFTAYVYQRKHAGDALQVTLVRGGETKELMIKIP